MTTAISEPAPSALERFPRPCRRQKGGPPNAASPRPPPYRPARPRQSPQRTPLPDVEPEPSSATSRFLVGLFVVVPLLALAAAVPLAWGWGLGWHDVVIEIGRATSELQSHVNLVCRLLLEKK